MTTRGILGPHVYEDVPFHQHEFSEISGELIVSEAQITSLSADKITSGTITAQTITIGAGGTIQSANFVTGSAGWQLAETAAEFADVIVRGDLIAGSWDGADPADLGTGIDSSATAGFYADSSSGRAQFTDDVFFGISTDNYIHFTTITNIGFLRWAGTLGSPTEDAYTAGWLAGSIPNVTGNLILTAYEWAGFEPGIVHLRSAQDVDGYVTIGSFSGQLDVGAVAGPGSLPGAYLVSGDALWLNTADILPVGTAGDIGATANEWGTLWVDALSHSGTISVTVPLLAAFGSASAPAYSYDGDDGLGLLRAGANILGVATDGTLRASFSDTDILFADGYNVEIDGARLILKDGTLDPLLEWTNQSQSSVRKYVMFRDDSDFDTWIFTHTDSGGSFKDVFRVLDHSIASHTIRDDTNTGTANILIDVTSGRLQRDTSSARYKKDIRPYGGQWNALDVPTVLFRGSRTVKGKRVFYRKVSLGITAEDAAAVHKELATYNADGEPEGVNWFTFVAAHQYELQQSRDKVSVLQDELAQMRDRITALEAQAA